MVTTNNSDIFVTTYANYTNITSSMSSILSTNINNYIFGSFIVIFYEFLNYLNN